MSATREITTPVTEDQIVPATAIDSVTLEVDDLEAARAFYETAFDLGDRVLLRAADAPTSGFRSFTLSLITSQPADVDVLMAAALGAGATSLKPAKRGLWGYGAVVQAPDGTIWKLATSSKKNAGAATGRIDDIVLLLGASDVPASKRFYTERGLTVSKSFARAYVEFASPPSAVKLGLYKRRALAKDAGVPAEGSGAHRIVVHSAAGPFTDPDGFACEVV